MITFRIRKEKDSDKDRIWKLDAEAFDTSAEANLVNVLRNSGIHSISLIAEENNELRRHILFTQVELDSYSGLKLMVLAPMAVTPAYQRKGIGLCLVEAGLKL